MDKQQSKDWKTRMGRMLQAQRFLAEGNSPATVAEKLGIKDSSNLYRDLKRFRELDFPFMSQVVDAVRKEDLLEKGKGDPIEKAQQSKIKRAEKGLFMGTRATGYRILDGKLFEIDDEIKRIKDLLYDFRVNYTDPAQLAARYRLPKSTVRRILENPVYIGEYVFLGKIYKVPYGGNAKPIITPEQFAEVQSMLHAPSGGYRLSKVLYRWKDGGWVAKPGAKEMARSVVEMRLEVKSSAEMARRLKVSRTVVDAILKDRRVTGEDNFEQLVEKKKWEMARKVHVPTVWELEEKRSADRKQRIMTHVPAYRWEIRDKIGLTKVVANFLIEDLKKDMLKERPDGLLQRAWEGFPDAVLSTRRKSETKRMKAILELLHAEKKLSLVELRQKTGFSKPNLQRHISRLCGIGVVERQDYWGYRIVDEWVNRVSRWLSQPHITRL